MTITGDAGQTLGGDPRARWRTLPTTVPPEEMTTGQVVEPLPEAMIDDGWQAGWRRGVEAGG